MKISTLSFIFSPCRLKELIGVPGRLVLSDIPTLPYWGCILRFLCSLLPSTQVHCKGQENPFGRMCLCCRMCWWYDLQSHGCEWVLISSALAKSLIPKGKLLILFTAFVWSYSQTETACKEGTCEQVLCAEKISHRESSPVSSLYQQQLLFTYFLQVLSIFQLF